MSPGKVMDCQHLAPFGDVDCYSIGARPSHEVPNILATVDSAAGARGTLFLVVLFSWPRNIVSYNGV